MKAGIALAVLTGATFVAVTAMQQATVRQLRSEVAAFKAPSGAPAQAGEPTSIGVEAMVATTSRPDSPLDARVVELERRVAELSRTSEYLMERGQAPLTRAKADALAQTLLNPAANLRDRVSAARLLIRNNMLDDTSAAQVASLLTDISDSRIKRDLIEQLQGATNAVLKTSLLQLAASDTDGNIRERAIERLGRFASDPQVEAQLWNSLRDTEGDVRRHAADILRQLPSNDARLAEVRQRGLSAESSLEERFMALQILQGNKQDLPELAKALAVAAVDNQDPELRLRVLQGFDRVAHPSFMSPLMQSLQDPNARIRREAADALSSFRDDPNVTQWLQHLAQTDTDPAVRQEASHALSHGRRGR